MNILPKKRWHVRTKENIARVRKDEAEAAEKERQEQLRTEAANKEARLNVLKQKSKQKLSELDIQLESREPEEDKNKHIEHINLFSDLEHAVQTTNKQHDEEIKEKKEEYEKKIGYLTYLGQDTNEALGKKNWYELPPETSRFARPDHVKDTYEKLVLKDEDGKAKKARLDIKDGEIDWKSKQRHDPIHAFKTKSKSKSSEDSSKHSNNAKQIKEKIEKSKNKHDKKDNMTSNLQKLREARLKREQQEKYKTELFLKKLNGDDVTKKNEEPKKITPKYNSQFNPEYARQNFR